MIETLKNFYKVLKAHAEFYEEERPQDLTVTFSLDQVKLLRNALMYLEDEQNKKTKELDKKR